MTATGWWQFGQFWTALGRWSLPYPAVYGSWVRVTTFAALCAAVPFISVLLVVALAAGRPAGPAVAVA